MNVYQSRQQFLQILDVFLLIPPMSFFLPTHPISQIYKRRVHCWKVPVDVLDRFMMEIWLLFFLIGLSAQQEYAYLRPTSLRFVQLQLVNGYIGHPVGQVRPWLDAPTGENQQNVATLVSLKHFFFLKIVDCDWNGLYDSF